jgi:hypothetical protein
MISYIGFRANHAARSALPIFRPLSKAYHKSGRSLKNICAMASFTWPPCSETHGKMNCFRRVDILSNRRRVKSTRLVHQEGFLWLDRDTFSQGSSA